MSEKDWTKHKNATLAEFVQYVQGKEVIAEIQDGDVDGPYEGCSDALLSDGTRIQIWSDWCCGDLQEPGYFIMEPR